MKPAEGQPGATSGIDRRPASCRAVQVTRRAPWLGGEVGDVLFGLAAASPGTWANTLRAWIDFEGLDDAAAAMGRVATVAGRYRTATIAGAEVRMLLAKNPAGWQEAIAMLEPSPTPVVCAINARIADGRDPSWLWDVPYEALRGRFSARPRPLLPRAAQVTTLVEFVEQHGGRPTPQVLIGVLALIAAIPEYQLC